MKTKTLFRKLLLGVFLFCISCDNSSSQNGNNKQTVQLNDLFAPAVKEFNRSLPAMIDEVTRLDLVSYTPGVLTYEATFLNVSREDVTTPEFKQNMLKQLTEGVKQQPLLRIFKENKTSFNFSYKEGGQQLYVLSVTPDMY